MKYIKFSIAVIVILFVVLGMLNGVIMSISKGSGVMVEVILFLLPLVATYLLIQYSWKRIVVEAESSKTDKKDIASKIKPSIETYKEKYISKQVIDSEQSTVDVDSIDDEIYEQVMLEIEEDRKVKSAWARALSQANGNSGKAEALYIQFRVKTLKDELHVENEINHQTAQNKSEKPQIKRDDYRSDEDYIKAKIIQNTKNASSKSTRNEYLAIILMLIVVVVLAFLAKN